MRLSEYPSCSVFPEYRKYLWMLPSLVSLTCAIQCESSGLGISVNGGKIIARNSYCSIICNDHECIVTTCRTVNGASGAESIEVPDKNWAPSCGSETSSVVILTHQPEYYVKFPAFMSTRLVPI